MKLIFLMLAALFTTSCDNIGALLGSNQTKIEVYQDKKLLRALYELRDKNVPTFTYTMDSNGKLHYLCKSTGFGIAEDSRFGGDSPSGVYSEGAGGRYVFCVIGKAVAPLYVKAKPIISTLPLGDLKPLLDEGAVGGNSK